MFRKEDIERYFVEEKSGGLLFLLTGVVSVFAAVMLVIFLISPFHKGIAIPMIILGIVFAATGFTVYRRSDSDRKKNVYAFDMDPGDLWLREYPRMQKVMKRFVLLKYAEIFLFVCGAVLFVCFMNGNRNDFWRGIGLGLSFMSFLALVFDNYAERRGRKYLEGLSVFSQKTGV